MEVYTMTELTLVFNTSEAKITWLLQSQCPWGYSIDYINERIYMTYEAYNWLTATI